MVVVWLAPSNISKNQRRLYTVQHKDQALVGSPKDFGIPYSYVLIVAAISGATGALHPTSRALVCPGFSTVGLHVWIVHHVGTGKIQPNFNV